MDRDGHSAMIGRSMAASRARGDHGAHVQAPAVGLRMIRGYWNSPGALTAVARSEPRPLRRLSCRDDDDDPGSSGDGRSRACHCTADLAVRSRLAQMAARGAHRETVSRRRPWRSRAASRHRRGGPAAQGLEVVFRPDPTIYDGRYNNNAWLQELPKPLTN